MNPRANDPPPLPAEKVTLPERGWRINPVKAIAATCVCWTAFTVIAWLVHHGQTTVLDRAGLLFWRNKGDLTVRGSAFVLEAVRDMTALGGALIMVLMVIAAVAALVFLRLRREAVLLFLTIIGGSVAETIMKLLFARERPDVVLHMMDAGGMSFPSGHSFHSALIYVAIALAFATISARESVRVTIISAALAISALIATSRVWLGVHFPSDVAAGWLAGVGWAFLASALFFRPAKAVSESEVARRLDPISE